MREAPGNEYPVIDDERLMNAESVALACGRYTRNVLQYLHSQKAREYPSIVLAMNDVTREYGNVNITAEIEGISWPQIKCSSTVSDVEPIQLILHGRSADLKKEANLDDIKVSYHEYLSQIGVVPPTDGNLQFEQVEYLVRCFNIPLLVRRSSYDLWYAFADFDVKKHSNLIAEYDEVGWKLLLAHKPSIDVPTTTSASSETLPMRHRISSLSSALDAYHSSSLSLKDVRSIHRTIFPNRDLPRFLRSEIVRSSTEARSLKQKDQTQSIRAHLEHANQGLYHFIKSYCSNVPEIANILTNFRSLQMSKTTPQHCIAALQTHLKEWPIRNASTERKHNIGLEGVLHVAAEVVDEARFLFIYLFAVRHISSSVEFVASVTLWLTCLEIDIIGWECLLNLRFWTWTEQEWIDQCKGVHDLWRKNGVWNKSGEQASDSTWTQLLYMQSLYGRGGTAVVWQTEFSSKISPPENILQFVGHGWSARAATETIKGAIASVMATAFPAASPSTFDTFMDNAYEWLVSGSSAGIPSVLRHSELRDIIIHHHKLFPRPTKRSVMEQIPREHVLEILRTSPKIVAKAHMKLNETGGKARAIYGVTLWHYIFSNWLLAPIERFIRHPNVDIGLPNSDFVQLMLNRAEDARQGCVFSSYDYPDFNAMHTHEHMAFIYQAAKDLTMSTAKYRSLSSEDTEIIITTFDWLRESTFRQIVIDPRTQGLVQTCGGLYSGNRDTTLINTLLNIAYAKVVDESLLAMNCLPRVRMRLCHGDDIVSVFENYPTAIAWNEVAAHCRLKGQEKKLLTDVSYHEYLRIMGCRDGVLRGCLARCVATFVNGNWETDRTVGLSQKAQEIFSNISTMYRRGASAATCQSIWKYSMRHFCSKIGSLAEHSESLWRVITQGSSESSMTKPVEFDKRHEPMTFRALEGYVTYPYLSAILKRLPDWIEVDSGSVIRMIDYLQQGTYGTELPVKFQDNDTLVGIHDLPILSFKPSKDSREVQRIRTTECFGMIEDSTLDFRLRRRICAIHTVLKCLHLSAAEQIHLIATVANTDQVMALKVLQTEGRISDLSAPDFDAAPELKALIASVKWSKLVTDQSYADPPVYDIVHIGGDFQVRPVRSIFRY